MGKEWSKINFPELRELKKKFKNQPEEYKDMVKKEIGKSMGIYDERVRQAYFLLCYPLMGMMGSKTIVNYYIDTEELHDFLKSTKIKIGRKDIIEILKNIFFKSNYEIKMKNIIYYWIHSKKLKRSLLCFIISIGEKVHLIFNDGEIGLSVGIGDDDYWQIEHNSVAEILSNDKYNKYTFEMITEILNEHIKLAINLLFYINTFPDKIIDTPPSDIIDKINKDNSKTITLSGQIRDYLHETRDISPHLRRGHFRHLSSDFYKNKKGQTVFVKASFVKRNAKTVIPGGEL